MMRSSILFDMEIFYLQALLKLQMNVACRQSSLCKQMKIYILTPFVLDCVFII